MKRNQVFYRVTLAVISVLLLNFGVHAEPANLDLLRKKIETYHNSGAYNTEVNAVALRATRFINKRSAQNHQSKHPKKLAIVLDIDETCLSNYFNMVPRQFVATKAQLVKEIHAANLPAIKPMLALYRDALRHGVAVFFVTGRHESDRGPTIANLKNSGFSRWSGIYFKPERYKKVSVISYKSRIRANITRKGYSIIASIGDQCSDLKGGYMEAGFKLPNPFYYLP